MKIPLMTDQLDDNRERDAVSKAAGGSDSPCRELQESKINVSTSQQRPLGYDSPSNYSPRCAIEK